MVCESGSVRFISVVWVLLAMVTPALTAQKGTGGGGQQTGGSGGGAQQQQAPGGQNGPSSTSVYRVESDMAALQASDNVAAEIATEIGSENLVVYDQPTFQNLQFYEAYSTEVGLFESAYSQIIKNSSGATLQDFAASATAAQTIISTLAAMRSSTETSAQQTNIAVDTLTAQLANHLGAGRVLDPKLFTGGAPGLDDLAPPDLTKLPASNCNLVSVSIPTQLTCLLSIRAQAATANPQKFQDVDKVFQSFLGNLLGSSVASSVVTPTAPVGGVGGGGAATPTTTTQVTAPQNPGSNNNAAPLTSVPIMSSVITGRRIKQQLSNFTSCSSSGGNGTKLLVLESTAAGGAYRIRHNFWVEVFWTTPDPSFNGGAVTTYVLVDPCTSSIIKANTLRYVYGYGKPEKTVKIKSRANFTPTVEGK
jgi:hypothetical protein